MDWKKDPLLGDKQTVGKFYRRWLQFNKNNQLILHNSEIVIVNKETRNGGVLTIRLSDNDAKSIINLETKIRSLLKQDLPTSRLKSEINKNQMNVTSHSVKGQIQTEIRDWHSNSISYDQLACGNKIDIVLFCDSLWSRTDYYPNYIYKWKIKSIISLE
jgi:hypothetical protein